MDFVSATVPRAQPQIIKNIANRKASLEPPCVHKCNAQVHIWFGSRTRLCAWNEVNLSAPQDIVHCKLMCKLRVLARIIHCFIARRANRIYHPRTGGEVGCWGLGKSGRGR